MIPETREIRAIRGASLYRRAHDRADDVCFEYDEVRSVTVFAEKDGTCTIEIGVPLLWGLMHPFVCAEIVRKVQDVTSPWAARVLISRAAI